MGVDNVVSILQTCRLFNLLRLEDQCAEFIAANLEKVRWEKKQITLHNALCYYSDLMVKVLRTINLFGFIPQVGLALFL